MKILYHGDLSPGATCLQRYEAFAALGRGEFIAHNARMEPPPRNSLAARVAWRLRRPIDIHRENERLVGAAATARPDVIYVDNSRVISAATLARLRALGVCRLVYYSPDDIIAPHNLSRPLERTLPHWDIIFTTKSFNVAELAQCGARRVRLVGNAFHAPLHRPLRADEVGPEFERFDIVFAGAFERDRFRGLLALARAGMSVVVYGAAPGRWGRTWTDGAHPNLTVRPPAFAEDYVRALHHGKVACCFLRKINRDRITQRSIEIPACARPMLGEKTDEHDAHFIDGLEYEGFGDAEALVAKARALLADAPRRARFALAGRARCLSSGYSTADRAREAMDEIEAVCADA